MLRLCPVVDDPEGRRTLDHRREDRVERQHQDLCRLATCVRVAPGASVIPHGPERQESSAGEPEH